MGADIQCPSSLSCELRIIRAKTDETIKSSTKNLFVRYYLSAGTNKRIQLNSREISSKSNDLLWNESFSLECCSAASSEDPMQKLKQETVVFELRCRNTTKPLLFGKLIGGGGSSHLLGRVEVPWKTVLESPEMEVEQWFTMSINSSSKSASTHVCDSVNKAAAPPALLQVGMKVRVPAAAATMEMEKRRKNASNRLLKKWDDECGCRDGTGCKDCGCNCVDDDIENTMEVDLETQKHEIS